MRPQNHAAHTPWGGAVGARRELHQRSTDTDASDPGEGGEEYERGGHPRHVLAPAMVMVSSPLLRLTQVPLLRTLCQVVIPQIFVRILFRG